MITRRSLLAAVTPAFLPFVATSAGDDTPEVKPKVFEKLFPEPTGTNGFEEIIRAGERVQPLEDVYFRRVNGGVPLSQQRAYLAHPDCREAAVLLRRGLAKPITIPEQDPLSEDVYLPFALMRCLARMLAAEIYVCLADGRTDVAVRIAAEGLTLGYPMKSVSVVYGLVARAMDQIALTHLVRQKDGWSVRDCRFLIRLAEQWLAAPDPTPNALSAERAGKLRMIEAWRANPEKWLDTLEKHYGSDGGTDSETPQARRAHEIAQDLRTDAGVRERVLREMADAVQYHFDRANALLVDPTGRLDLAPPPETDRGRHYTVPFLRDTFLLNARGTVQRSVEGRVTLQLLAVHAAIHAHRWEAGRLPESLDDLSLAAPLMTDPFTVKPLLYVPENSGTGYELASAGPLVPGRDGKPDARERITLPWTQPK